jgi:DNA-binding beta-propeller fold protein YncE
MPMLALAAALLLSAPPQEPLTLARTIPLAGVEGRIDHIVADAKGEHLYIAALGNGSLEVVDLEKGERTKSVKGLKEPQGVAFVSSSNAVAVACGGDGSLHLYDAGTLEEKAKTQAGEDADNARFDEKNNLIWVGIADGALAVFDAKTLEKKHEVALKGHPESFQLEAAGSRVFANVPGGFVGGGGAIAVIDRDTLKVTETWALKDAGRNFAMALDRKSKRLYVPCRRPARLLAISTETGAVEAQAECIGDTDDVFIDDQGRILVIGGDGAIDVFEAKDKSLTRTASVKTQSGARTGLLVPQRHALYVAVPARSGHPAELREYKLEEPTKRPSVK